MTLPPKPPIASWVQQLARIEDEQLAPLLEFRHIIRQMHSVLDRFQGVVPPAHEIAEYFRMGYSAFACSRLRNFDEPQATRADRRIVSLRAMLDEMTPYCPQLTRKWFTAQYPPGPRKMADRDFDRVTDTPGCDHLPETVVARDIERLNEVMAPFRLITNKHLAHTSEVRLFTEQFPTYREVSEAIDKVVEVFVRYRLLLTQKAGELVPLDELDVVSDFERLFREE